MLAQGDGNGGFDLIEFSQDQREAATSLGVVITDFDGVAGNEIFVGNDMKPNQLCRRDVRMVTSQPSKDVLSVLPARPRLHGHCRG